MNEEKGKNKGKNKRKTLSKKDAVKVLDLLDAEYPDAGCALDYRSEFSLLTAVMLSAQTTDVSVNKVTPILFDRYPCPADLAAAEIKDIEEIIKSIGLYKTKAVNIRKTAAMIEENYGGKVPADFDELIKLPGVGRKTANVVMAEAFGAQKIAVDTHVFRVSNRIGLAAAPDPLKTEEALMKILPEDRWTRAHHLLIFHGRRCCIARKPECERCVLGDICLYNKTAWKNKNK